MRKFSSLLNSDSLGAAAAFAAQLAGAGFAFLFSVLLARLVGVSGVGVYFIAMTIVDISATVSRLGLESAALRFASIAHAEGDRGTLAAIYRKSMGLVVGAGIVIALLVWMLVPQLSLGGDRAPELLINIPLVLFAVAPLAALAVQSEFFKATGAPATGTFVQGTVPQLLWLLGALALWWRGNATLRDVFVAYAVVAVIAVLYAVVRWSRRQRGVWRQRGHFATATLLRVSTPILLVTSINLVMGWTDILVLGFWSDAKQVGLYGVAMRVAALTGLVLAAAGSVVAPQFAALHAQGKHTELARLASQSARWIMLASLPLILVLLIVPELVLQLFGESFREAAWPLRILALGQLVNVATGLVGSLLVMTGHEKSMRNNIAIAAGLNLVGNLVLVPVYGATGAAASTAFCLAWMNIASWLVVRRKLDIDTLRYFYSRNGSRS